MKVQRYPKQQNHRNQSTHSTRVNVFVYSHGRFFLNQWSVEEYSEIVK